MAAFVDNNLTVTTFVVGLLVFCGSLAAWSKPLAGMVGGAILMTVAAYPYVVRRNG